MKKIIFLSLLAIILIWFSLGGIKETRYIGEGANWRGEYELLFSGKNCYEGNFAFTFKDGTRESVFKDIEIDIDDRLKFNEEEYHGATVPFRISDSSCSSYVIDEQIDLIIKWDNGIEESFIMKEK